MNDDSLLHRLGAEMSCLYLSDLHCLQKPQRTSLAERIALIPTQAYDLRQWNNALGYLTGSPGESSAEAAKRKLTTLLKL